MQEYITFSQTKESEIKLLCSHIKSSHSDLPVYNGQHRADVLY